MWCWDADKPHVANPALLGPPFLSFLSCSKVLWVRCTLVPPGWLTGQLVNADSFCFQCSFFLVPSRQEKMPLVIPHNNYNDAHPSSTDLICIQSGCQEGVFSPVLIRRKCSETVTGEDSFPLPCVGRLQREAEPPTGCVETDQTQEQRGNGRLSKGAGRVNWGGGCSCLAVNLNVALHRWERSIQAAVKLPLKLTEHFSVLRKK